MKGDLLKRTISFMTGKGSLNHNSRKFHAKNTDPNRTHWNVEYCNEDIKDVYHELFDDALKDSNCSVFMFVFMRDSAYIGICRQ